MPGNSLHSPAFLRAAARSPGLSKMSIQGCTAPLRFIRFIGCTYAHRVTKNRRIEFYNIQEEEGGTALLYFIRREMKYYKKRYIVKSYCLKFNILLRFLYFHHLYCLDFPTLLISIDEKFETTRKMWAERVGSFVLIAQRCSNITTSICIWPQHSPGETNNSAYCLDLRVARVRRVSISRITEQPRSVDGEGARRSLARPELNPRRIPELPFVLSNLPLTAVTSMVQAVPDVETRAPCRSHTCDPDDSYWGPIGSISDKGRPR